MKVLLISGTYPDLMCGVGDYTANLAAALTGLPDIDEVHVLTSAGPGPSEATAGVELHRVMNAWSVGETGRVASVVRRVVPDVVHLQYPSRLGAQDRGALANAIPWVIRAALRRRPRPALVTTLHEFSDRSSQFRARAWSTLAASDAVVYTSEFDETSALAWPLLERGPRRVVPIAPNLVPREGGAAGGSVRRRRGLSPDSFLAVHFGLLAEDRGLEVLAEASRWLAKDGVEVLVIGEPPPRAGGARPGSRPDLEALREAEASGALRRLGHLPAADLSMLLAAADVAVFPFEDGAAPRRGSLLAAMAHGLAIVTTRGPRVPASWGAPDEPALWVDPGDPAGLAAAVLKLRDDAALRRRLAAGGRRLAGRISWDEIAARTASLYFELVAGA